jgi:hypothetical protein
LDPKKYQNNFSRIDYSRRLYVPKDKRGKQYPDAMREYTDKRFDTLYQKKHSEDKKPYRHPDYLDMEYFWTPFGPYWDPPGSPVGPYPSSDSTWIVPGVNPEQDLIPEQYVGCFFYVPLTPRLLEPGQTAFAKLERRDDPVVALSVSGPARVISSTKNVRNCTWAYESYRRQMGYAPQPSSPECTVIIQVAYDVSPYEMNAEGYIPVTLTAQTYGGAYCSTTALVLACPPPNPVEWDWDLSAETVAPSSSCLIAVENGVGPYQWQVSGTGFSLAKASTDGRSNTLITAADACGTAIITVTDFCDDETQGEVRCTDGQWDPYTPVSCVIPGEVNDAPGTRIEGGWKQLQGYTNYGLSSTGGCPSGLNCTATGCRDGTCLEGVGCDTTWGCTECITFHGCDTKYTCPGKWWLCMRLQCPPPDEADWMEKYCYCAQGLSLWRWNCIP